MSTTSENIAEYTARTAGRHLPDGKPAVELVVVDEAGHETAAPAMAAALLAATDRFAGT